jgi:spore germination protein (amino acid permease)
MQQKQYISKVQAVFLVFFSLAGVSLYAFSIVYSADGRGAWVTDIVGALMLIPPALWLLYLGGMYPGKTILEIIEITAGKIVSRIINTVFILVSIVLAVCMLNFFASLIQIYFLINTPTWVTMLVVTALGTLMARSGIETMGRLFAILVVLIILLFFPGQGMGIGQFKMENLIPVFFTAPFRLVAGTYEHACQFSEALLFIMVMTSALPSPVKYFKAISAGFILLGFSYGLAGMICIALLGIEVFSSMPFSAINVSQSVQVGGFIHGLEIFILIPYTFIEYSKIAIYLYGSWTAARQICNDWKPQLHLWVLSAVTIGAAVWVNSYNTAYYLAVMISRYFMLPFILLVLSIATIGCLVKKRRKGRLAAK